jgi:hypothetical protein
MTKVHDRIDPPPLMFRPSERPVNRGSNQGSHEGPVDETLQRQQITIGKAAPTSVNEPRAPYQQDVTPSKGLDCGLHMAMIAGVVVGALGLGWLCLSNWYLRNFADRAAIHAIVERIVRAESDGDPNARNKRSSATGAAQFLEGTWLDLIRAHRPDLARRNEKEALDLRYEPELAREITTRFAERNARFLRERGFPVTPGTLYLSHFAGPAGAAAVLSAAEGADAASIMANADATGRTTREKIVKANPFLARFTAANLKNWSDRKIDAEPTDGARRKLTINAVRLAARQQPN